jgi:hypothetical protein
LVLFVFFDHVHILYDVGLLSLYHNLRVSTVNNSRDYHYGIEGALYVCDHIGDLQVVD